MQLTDLHLIAIAVGLGLLVGLQRERVHKTMGGIRTFPLISILGSLCAFLSREYGGWVVATGLLSLAALLVSTRFSRRSSEDRAPGLTTETAMLVMFGVGAALVAGYVTEGVLASGGLSLLLHWKRPLHRFARGISESEFRALLRLILIALVVLPVLPNRDFGPYGVINPFSIWLMVVLIVGISTGAYVAQKIIGARGGALLAGVLGGLISSTATTVSYAHGVRKDKSATLVSAVVVVMASVAVFIRVMIEIALVARDFLPVAAPPLGVMMAGMALVAWILYLRSREDIEARTETEPPSSLRGAIVFGALYAVVLIGVAAARHHFGDTALYVVATLSGLTDMDAITLSTAQMTRSGRLDMDIGWRLVLLGAMGNLVFKGLAVAVIGSPRLLARIAPSFIFALLLGALLLAFWP